MQIASFDETLEILDALDPWLALLGIRIQKSDRWHEALKMLVKAREARRVIESGGTRKHIENYVPSLFDATEIHDIVKAFAGQTSPALRETVKRALSGPVAPLSEQPSNSVARNATFELALAAGWKNGGADVLLAEPDILLRIAKTDFMTACKRPFYENRVWPNIEAAAHQVARELGKPGNEKAYGVVAISLTRVFTNGELMCIAPEGKGRAVVNDALAEMIEVHGKEWGRPQFKGLHERIAAVMFHLAVPWDVNGERLINMASSNFVKTGNGREGWEILTKNLPKIY